MKRIFSTLLLCIATLGIFAQESKQEIVKTGWNFGPLPVVGWDRV